MVQQKAQAITILLVAGVLLLVLGFIQIDKANETPGIVFCLLGLPLFGIAIVILFRIRPPQAPI